MIFCLNGWTRPPRTPDMFNYTWNVPFNYNLGSWISRFHKDYVMSLPYAAWDWKIYPKFQPSVGNIFQSHEAPWSCKLTTTYKHVPNFLEHSRAKNSSRQTTATWKPRSKVFQHLVKRVSLKCPQMIHSTHVFFLWREPVWRDFSKEELYTHFLLWSLWFSKMPWWSPSSGPIFSNRFGSSNTRST